MPIALLFVRGSTDVQHRSLQSSTLNNFLSNLGLCLTARKGKVINMKTKIVSILAAAAFTIGSFTNVYAADTLTKTAAYNYAVMSESEKTDFINANLSTRLQQL